jgi:hypothetical protein
VNTPDKILARCIYCGTEIDKNIYPQYIDNPVECNLICRQCHDDTLEESDVCEHCHGTGTEPMGLFACTECLGDGISI